MSENEAAKDAANPTTARVRVGDHVAIFLKRESRFWHIDYSIGGRQFRHSLKTTSKKEAQNLAKKKNAEIVLGSVEDPAKRTTIAAAIEKYLNAKAVRLDDKTIKLYRRDLLQFAAYARSRGIVRLDRVEAEVLEDYQLQLSTKGLMGIASPSKRGPKFKLNKPSTVRGKMKTIRQLFRFAVRRRLIPRDAAAGYQLPPKSRTEAFCWSTTEVQAILQAASSYWRARFEFLACTGLRADELCWLLKDDVTIAERRAFVQIRAKTCPQTSKLWHPKHRRERRVPLCARAVQILRGVMAESPGPWAFWFPNTRSKQFGHTRPDVMWRALKSTMKTAGVARGTVHTLRHVFCSFAANHKIPAFQVMKILGHGSLDIVLLYYHVHDDELFQAVNDVPFDKLLQTAAKEEN